jgi:alpha-tubulin suppressor-like RCC1 family protein
VLVAAIVASVAVTIGVSAQAQAASTVKAWGLNLSDQLGGGIELGPEECSWSGLEVPCSRKPVVAGTLSGVLAVAGGEEYSSVLLEAGPVFAWGSDEAGQLGDGLSGPEGESDVPVEVSRLNDVTAIAAGGEHGLALLENHTVFAWGGGEFGQLGERKQEDSDLPIGVSTLSGVKAIAAGEEHSLALLENHTVKSWGYNGSGQLGDGTAKNKQKPIAVNNLSGVVAIAAGGEHSLALLENGTVMAWGSNEYGQLGDGTSSGPGNCGTKKAPEPCSRNPVAVTGLSDVRAIAAGGEHSLALLDNGTVMAWGDNESGELGDGERADSDIPVAVSGLSGVVAIAAGEEDSLALLENGTVMAWGNNEFGQLGDEAADGPERCGAAGGEVPCSSIPVPVSGLSGVTGIAAGGAHSLAFGPSTTEAEPGVALVDKPPISRGVYAAGEAKAIARGHLHSIRARKRAERRAKRGRSSFG